jgi:exonuclease III
MKIISFNCKGLASPHKKSSLKHLVFQIGPDVLFLQETLGSSEAIKESLQSLLPGWEFMTMDAKGRSEGLATGWRSASCHLSNS